MIYYCPLNTISHSEPAFESAGSEWEIVFSGQ